MCRTGHSQILILQDGEISVIVLMIVFTVQLADSIVLPFRLVCETRLVGLRSGKRWGYLCVLTRFSFRGGAVILLPGRRVVSTVRTVMP